MVNQKLRLLYREAKDKKTMAVSPMKGSKRSPLSSSSKSKLKQRITWEIKRKLVNERLMGLTDKTKNEESTNTERRIICYPPTEKQTSDLSHCDVVSTSAMERAQEIEANLPIKFPSFVKNLLKSHVTGGFWLGLPRQFCVAHLPKHDETVVLVGENEEKYNTRYLVEKNGLSGGWRGFALAHKLLEGDVLVFELIKSCKFKVHIARGNALPEENAARSLLDLHAEPIETVMEEDQLEENAENTETLRMEEDQPEEVAEISETTAQKYREPVALDHIHNQKKKRRKLISYIEPSEDHSCNNIANSDHEFPDGLRFSETPLSFNDVRSFGDFEIQVDGLILDSEIPTHLRTKYYELCQSQKNFLHENLMKGLNSKLASGMISETINIADAIRAAKPSTSRDDLEGWDKTLKAFADLGMMVGFLRARIDKLLSLRRESQAVIEMKRNELREAKDEMRGLKAKVSSVGMLIEKLGAEIGRLKVKNKELGFVFTEIACAPW